MPYVLDYPSLIMSVWCMEMVEEGGGDYSLHSIHSLLPSHWTSITNVLLTLYRLMREWRNGESTDRMSWLPTWSETICRPVPPPFSLLVASPFSIFSPFLFTLISISSLWLIPLLSRTINSLLSIHFHASFPSCDPVMVPYHATYRTFSLYLFYTLKRGGMCG